MGIRKELAVSGPREWFGAWMRTGFYCPDRRGKMDVALRHGAVTRFEYWAYRVGALFSHLR